MIAKQRDSYQGFENFNLKVLKIKQVNKPDQIKNLFYIQNLISELLNQF